MTLTLSTPLSLYSIPVMWFLAYYPSFLKGATIQGIAGLNKLFHSVDPRGNVARLSEKKINPDVVARIKRMEGAHFNGVESFPLWSLAVLVGNYAGLDNQTLNIVSSLYLFSRVVYNQIYINQTTEKQGSFRSIVWATGLTLPFYLLIKAANIVRHAAV
ncbi:hypothetical protein BDQ12DRAFT_726909 [Crucibulum laeve]|uniref:Membrane-associated, eicosanoid/glutathione metabolism protein n=1 Tax=Crucibulum laeve TaxID=68775 RepID=A0A5C3LPJ5_9AGAR|nr:hypothetical protein BDQ12DRAFT_726909 [Crucibulum laeve]